MSVLNKIGKREIRDLLGKGWLTHDGMWFYHTYQELGIEKANKLNKAAIRSLAPIEIKRIKKALGIDEEKIGTFEELKDFLLEAFEMTLPDSVFKRFRLRASSKDLLHWQWENGECFAYKGMKQIGIIDGYRCGVMYRIECWLETLGIKYSIDPKIDKCMMLEKGACLGDIRVILGD
ncbi:MAG: DUF6125 family protein [Desulfobacterales bacterium]